jgi:hypothetical protein
MGEAVLVSPVGCPSERHHPNFEIESGDKLFPGNFRGTPSL